MGNPFNATKNTCKKAKNLLRFLVYKGNHLL